MSGKTLARWETRGKLWSMEIQAEGDGAKVVEFKRTQVQAASYGHTVEGAYIEAERRLRFAKMDRINYRKVDLMVSVEDDAQEGRR